jgi:hypothetical protein
LRSCMPSLLEQLFARFGSNIGRSDLLVTR